MKLLKYEGFILEDAPLGYQSVINGKTLTFNTVIEWRKLIDQLSALRPTQNK